MPRRLALFVTALQVFFGLACSGDPEEPAPHLVTTDATTVDGPAPVPCKHRGTTVEAPTILAKPDEPVTFHIRALEAVDSCRCEYIVHPQWSCSSDRVCESEYDLGSVNPDECHRVSEADLPVSSTSVSDDSDCDVTVAVVSKSEGRVDVTVKCPVGQHYVSVDLDTAKGRVPGFVGVEVTDDGECPLVGVGL